VPQLFLGCMEGLEGESGMSVLVSGTEVGEPMLTDS
jgi:hypothetical protein